MALTPPRAGSALSLLAALASCVEVDNPFIDSDAGALERSDGGMSGMGGGAAGGAATGGGAAGGAATGGGAAGGAATGGGAAGGGAGGAGGSGGGSACTESWLCGLWRAGSNGTATRTCVDANGCGTVTNRPGLGPVALPSLDFNFYQCNVEPIVDRGCAMMGCHGDVNRPYRIYARGRLRRDELVPARTGPSCTPGTTLVNLDQTGTAAITCMARAPHTTGEWQANFDSARAFMIGFTSPAASPLLDYPTRGTAQLHSGFKYFTANDPSWTVIANWLGGATRATCDPGAN